MVLGEDMDRIKYENYVKRYVNCFAPMRDGVKLAFDLYLPKGEGPFAVIFIRTPYQKSPAVSPRYEQWGYYYAQHNFAYVVCDIRGKGDSEGHCDPFMQESTDGYDLCEWLAQQPWCNGNVATEGNSYLAFVQYLTYRHNPPHLKAMAVSGGCGDLCKHGMSYLNGIKCLYMANWYMYTNGRSAALDSARYLGENAYDSRSMAELMFTLPLTEMDKTRGFDCQGWQDSLLHDVDDDFYEPTKFLGKITPEHKVPVLHTFGHFDTNSHATYDYYKEMVECGGQADHYFIMGPWQHEHLVEDVDKVEQYTFKDAIIDIKAQKIKFFNKYLYGKEEYLPSCRMYDMNSQQWTEYDQKEGCSQLLLHLQDNKLVTEPNTTTEQKLISNPFDPALAYQYACPFDATPYANSRQDILVYQYTAQQETTIFGMPSVSLNVKSPCSDTNFFAYVTCEVDGRQQLLSFGGMSLACRDGNTERKEAQPNVQYNLSFDMDYMYAKLQPGQKLQLHITSNCFLMYAVNANVFKPAKAITPKDLQIAENIVLEAGSKITLPIL